MTLNWRLKIRNWVTGTDGESKRSGDSRSFEVVHFDLELEKCVPDGESKRFGD